MIVLDSASGGAVNLLADSARIALAFVGVQAARAGGIGGVGSELATSTGTHANGRDVMPAWALPALGRIGTGSGPGEAGQEAPPQAVPIAVDGLFGWLHRGCLGRGVVLCGAQGFEQVAAHRAWRDLAERIAATGCSVLRFDYPGDGDAADLDAPRPADWVASIRRAMRVLREEAGAQEIALVGLRLGGTLAALAAQEEPVERLALLAPFLTGRAYRREMTMRGQTINRRADGSLLPQEPGELTVGGFRLAPQTLADLDAVDLRSVAGASRRPAAAALLLGPAEPLQAPLAALGVAVTTGPLPGLAQLVGDPIFATQSHETASAIAAFVSEGARPLPHAAAAGSDFGTPISGPGWVEEPVRFGPGLFGILCLPREGHPRGSGVVLLPTGKTVRSGWGRQTSTLGRGLAADGFCSLRLDLLGIGDAQDRPDGASPLFAADSGEQIRAAVDLVSARCDGPAVLVGTCSGAHAAFHAACRDPRIGGALIVNLARFDWDSGEQVEAALRERFGRASTYAGLLRSGATWRRLLRGQVAVRAIGTTLALRALAQVKRRTRRLFREGPVGGSVKRRIAALRRRGAHVRFLFSEGDPGLPDVLRPLGRSQRRAAAILGAPIGIVPGADHNLSTRGAQDRFAGDLRALLDSVQASRPDHPRSAASPVP